MTEGFSDSQQQAIQEIVTRVSNEEISNNYKYQINRLLYSKLAVIGTVAAAIGFASLLYFPKVIATKAIEEELASEISSLKQEVERVTSMRNALIDTSIQSGSVVGFVGPKCPNGWSEFKEARNSLLIGATSLDDIQSTSSTFYKLGENPDLSVIDGNTTDTDGERINVAFYSLYFCSKD